MPDDDTVRILTIFARYGTTRFADAEARLGQIFAVQLPDVERDVVVVDSALPLGVHETSQGRTVCGGDNSGREFSAFESALEIVGPAVWDYDLVNLATAAFSEMYAAYLERFRQPVLQAIVGQPVCLGHVDCYNEPIEVLGTTSQHWLRTCCVFLPPAELRILGALQSTRDRTTWFSGIPERPFLSDAPLSENYRQLLIGWLTGQDIGQGVKWHSRLRLDPTGLSEFEQKAMAILNEHLFGIRLRAAGCHTVDVTWLSSVLGRSDSWEWDTPWWEQLAGRDQDQLHVMPGMTR